MTSGSLRSTLAALFAAIALLAACTTYVTNPQPSKYDQAWNAALGGVQDAGVEIRHAEPTSGMIVGTKDGIEVTVSVRQLGNGNVEVRFDSKGQTSKDPQLADRFSKAYDRRMGRY